MANTVCPIDGRRLVKVSWVNPEGDSCQRWECPVGDWDGPWYGGGDVSAPPIPELIREGRVVNLTASSRIVQTNGIDSPNREVGKVTVKNPWPAGLDPDGGLPVHVMNPSSGGGGGTVALDAATLAALENISALVSGTITVANPTANPETGLAKDATLVAVRDYLDTVETLLAQVRDRITNPLPVSGSVGVTNFPSTFGVVGNVEVTNDVGNPLPVSGPLTDAQLRATPVPISGTVAIGAGTSPTFKGRANSFRTPGRAGTTGQNLMAIWNPTTKVVRLKGLAVDMYCTVVKAVTVAPPVIRAHRITAAPTNGTALTKVAEDTSLTSDAGIVVSGDASADGVSSASALAATVAAGTMLTQEPAPRLITAAGYEMFDRTVFFDTSEVVLRQNQGAVLRLDYVLATQNPITDMWLATAIWTEE